MRTLASILILAAALLGAGSAYAETSIYVVDQPELSLVLEAKGDELYAAYLSAEVLCYGAGGHWYEGPTSATHRAFQVRPRKLPSGEGRFRLVRTRRDQFDSSTEVLAGEVRPDGIVGTFSYYVSGEGTQGSCEQNAPGFEPQSSSEREPPVSFEARRYVPVGSSLATAPDLAAESLYFRSTRQLEIVLWASDTTVTKLLGAARETCTSRRGHRDVVRAALEPAPPFSLESGSGRFEGRAGRDWLFLAATSHLEGWVSADSVLGRYRAAIAYRNDRKARFYELCRTGGRRDDDGYVGFRAFRYLPVAIG